jgi:catalase
MARKPGTPTSKPRSGKRASLPGGGETHQKARADAPAAAFLTTNHGLRISDNQNSLKLGTAHGYFECTRAIPDLTRATVFAKKGKRTPLFCRFSTVAGSKGSKDTSVRSNE